MLVDKYLDRADELDVDALCDREGNVVITGIMQHIEQVRHRTGRRLSLDRKCLIYVAREAHTSHKCTPLSSLSLCLRSIFQGNLQDNGTPCPLTI